MIENLMEICGAAFPIFKRIISVPGNTCHAIMSQGKSNCHKDFHLAPTSSLSLIFAIFSLLRHCWCCCSAERGVGDLIQDCRSSGRACSHAFPTIPSFSFVISSFSPLFLSLPQFSPHQQLRRSQS